MRYSAAELAEVLGSAHRPTDEQARVIESDLGPMLVVAGAGSGKTATMTDRVVWLVANGVVAPSEILGLTFTRKAASELAARVERALRILARATRVEGQEPEWDWLTERPRISTYNSYAAGLVTDHGVRLGLEADQSLLTEAGRYQVAMAVVEAWPHELDIEKAPVTVAKAVVTLAGELAEHLLSPEEAAARLRSIAEGLADAEPSGRRKNPHAPYAETSKVIDALMGRAELMPLVEAFAASKRARGAMDFPDQVAAAADLARRFPVVGERERETARVVLLDEYQDTSVAQLQMLRALFGGGHPITAVGDPHQGIYGWRGASAGALLSFPEHFPRGDQPAPVATLSTSWRNDRGILGVANRAAGPLRDASTVVVPPLQARPGAGQGEVVWTYLPDHDAESRAVVEAIVQRWQPGSGTAAVLCRKRDFFTRIRQAAIAAGVPVQVVGLSGLLHTPAVSDVRAALTAAFDPSRGDALMRLLTGPAFRLGASDLMALSSLANDRTRSMAGPDQASEAVDGASIVEALDLAIAAGEWKARDGRSISEAGRARIGSAQNLLRHVRSWNHLGLPDLILAVEQALGLDLELTVVGGQGRADLDAFVEAAADFEAGSTAPTLGAFLTYLEDAEEYERGLDVAASEPDPSSLQILTIHAAKGLEWDVVAVVGLNEQDFPGLGGTVAEPTASAWLTGLESLPYEMRGDAEHLPDLEILPGATHKDVELALKQLRRDDGDRELAEERRLAYVAFTRARTSLILTGSWWSSRAKPNSPSRFLTEAIESQLASPLPGAPPDFSVIPDQPEDSAAVGTRWPPDQDAEATAALARARAAVREARELVVADRSQAPSSAGAVHGVRASGGEPSDTLSREWEWQAGALLAERERESDPSAPEPPAHLSASAVVALADDPVAFAAARRRPVPTPPSTQARRGTRFHAWIERHYARAALLDVDELLGEDIANDEELEGLQEAFLASPWATREPIAIEVDVETPVAGVQVRCRIDAVFGPVPGEDLDVHIVDWKTGSPPRGRKDREARELQLALYRLGWSRLHGVPIDRIGASFHFVAHGSTQSAPMLSEPEVEALIAANLSTLTPSAG